VFRLYGTLLPINEANIRGKLDLLQDEEIKTLVPEDTDLLARQLMSEEQYEKV